ncbi:MAG: hypothetical protein J1F35_08200 [Erysipelotrichales bacterium]|nr:hypothetical protein [Erysipelotrichales bacterium]
MTTENIYNLEDFDIIEFEKYHWKFIQKEDHIDIYENREGNVIGGFYSPEASFTLKDIIEKTQDMSEEEAYDFIHNYIKYY